MPLVFLPDARLYSDDVYCRSAFRWPEAVTRPPLIYHCYWRGVLTRHQELSMKSLLISQSPPYELWLWVPPEYAIESHEWAARVLDHPSVRVKAYVPEIEAEGTIYEGHLALLQGHDRFGVEDWRRPLNLSNGLRILALARYGGVYFDLDTLFLADVRPLCTVDFFYQWSDRPYGNNAISHLARGSANAWALAERSAALGSCRPARLLYFEELQAMPDPVYVFPTSLFDPVWLAHDGRVPGEGACRRFGDFFTSTAPTTLESFFPGAYAHHWHNRWDTPIEGHSIAGQLYRSICAVYARRGDVVRPVGRSA